MAVRTSAAAIRVLSPDFDEMSDDALFDPHIQTANFIVNDNITTATGDKYELIERWLAAHFATVYVRESTSEKAGAVAVKYEGNAKAGARIESTRFGRMAIVLDDTGALAQLNDRKTKKQTAGISNAGEYPPCKW